MNIIATKPIKYAFRKLRFEAFITFLSNFKKSLSFDSRKSLSLSMGIYNDLKNNSSKR
jgi:hypothetical protein